MQHQVEDGTYEAGSRAAYVQDSWAVTRNLTVNFGVRWEGYDNTNAEGETFLEIADQFAPRLGIAWDVRGDGSAKLYGSLGVYHLPMSTRASINLGSSDYEDEGWYVLEGGINPDGSPGRARAGARLHRPRRRHGRRPQGGRRLVVRADVADRAGGSASSSASATTGRSACAASAAASTR